MCTVSKLVLAQCGPDGKEACGSTQLWASLEAGIEGAIHTTMQKVTAKEDFVFNELEVIDNSLGATAASGTLPPDPATANDTTTLPPSPVPEPLTDPTILLLTNSNNVFNNLCPCLYAL